MDARLFMSLYTLFNLYLYLIAYLYSPCVDYSSNVKPGMENIAGYNNIKNGKADQFNKMSDADKERIQIMNDFYEQELKEEDDVADHEIDVLKKSQQTKNVQSRLSKQKSIIELKKSQENFFQKE